MVRVVFEYMDRYTNGEWNRQRCIVESVEECKRIEMEYNHQTDELKILEHKITRIKLENK